MSMLSDMGITVVESEDHEEGAAAPDGEDGADEEDAGGRAVATSAPVPAITQARTEPAEHTDDPVRMYLRDMGSIEPVSSPPIACDVHLDGPALNRCSIEGLDGGFGLRLNRHFYKTEPSRLTGDLVGN
jgi:hypothetical protein